MRAPYIARVRVGDGILVLDESDVQEGVATACRYYDSAATGTYVGFTRAAVFTVGALLDADESAEVEIVGMIGSGSAKTETVACHERVRRDSAGRLVLTLGSRFNERVFNGA